MSESTSKPSKKMISTEVHTLTASVTSPPGLFRPARKQTKSWRVLGTKDLLKSLLSIKETANEEHVRNNLDILIEQILDAKTDV